MREKAALFHPLKFGCWCEANPTGYCTMDEEALRSDLRGRLEQQGVAGRLQLSIASALTHKATESQELVEPSVELQSLIAANLLEDSELGKALPGLAHALRTMAAKMPEDPTEWLCARLKASRPVVAREYTESVLKAHVMKCDEVCPRMVYPRVNMRARAPHTPHALPRRETSSRERLLHGS